MSTVILLLCGQVGDFVASKQANQELASQAEGGEQTETRRPRTTRGIICIVLGFFLCVVLSFVIVLSNPFIGDLVVNKGGFGRKACSISFH